MYMHTYNVYVYIQCMCIHTMYVYTYNVYVYIQCMCIHTMYVYTYNVYVYCNGSQKHGDMDWQILFTGVCVSVYVCICTHTM